MLIDIKNKLEPSQFHGEQLALTKDSGPKTDVIIFKKVEMKYNFTILSIPEVISKLCDSFSAIFVNFGNL